MKSESTEQQLNDTVLEALLSGESVATLSRMHPKQAKDIAAYAQMLGTLASVHKETPSSEGLRRALASIPNKRVSRAIPSPYPFLVFMNAHRATAALPLLLVILAASGWFLLPRHAAAPNADLSMAPQTTSQAAMNEGEHAPVSSTQNAKMALAQNPTSPADPALTDVFSSEMAHDSDASAPTSTGGTNSDAQDIAAFSDAYDPNEL